MEIKNEFIELNNIDGKHLLDETKREMGKISKYYYLDKLDQYQKEIQDHYEAKKIIRSIPIIAKKAIARDDLNLEKGKIHIPVMHIDYVPSFSYDVVELDAYYSYEPRWLEECVVASKVWDFCEKSGLNPFLRADEIVKKYIDEEDGKEYEFEPSWYMKEEDYEIIERAQIEYFDSGPGHFYFDLEIRI